MAAAAFASVLRDEAVLEADEVKYGVDMYCGFQNLSNNVIALDVFLSPH